MARLHTAELLDNYYLRKRLPTIWCPGCGLGTALAAFMRGFADSGLDRDRTVIVNGIGCSGRTASYLDFDVLKGTHGRAIAFATGVKLWRPELTVIVMAGDGDLLAIGGNHFIHAARRDMDITVLLFNNQIYGMTGGQVSPTTPSGKRGSTAPRGSLERPFDACRLAEGAGASYIARATAYHTQLLQRLAARALLHKGFSLLEVMVPCPEMFGRLNGQGTPTEMLLWQKTHAVRFGTEQADPDSRSDDAMVIGELLNQEPTSQELVP